MGGCLQIFNVHYMCCSILMHCSSPWLKPWSQPFFRGSCCKTTSTIVRTVLLLASVLELKEKHWSSIWAGSMKLLGKGKLKFTSCSKSQELRCRLTLIWRQCFCCKCLWLNLGFYLQPSLLFAFLALFLGTHSLLWSTVHSMGESSSPCSWWSNEFWDIWPTQLWLKNLVHLHATVCMAHSKCI